ncbi:MAG: endonuclease III [Candidatus Rifleibacteriota bacterium]
MIKSDLAAKADKIIRELEKKYPEPKCALKHENAWQLLVATILSAQCTDKRVNMVTPGFFKKFPSIESIANAKQKDVENAIRSTGFFRNKAKNIIACANMLLNEFSGKIPDTLEELVKLPGVGRKTGSVILGTIYKKAEGIVVDTHVKRLSFRMGFTCEKDPEKIEKDLMKIIKPEKWIDFSHLLILHGRERCVARRPDCEKCEIVALCPRIGIY